MTKLEELKELVEPVDALKQKEDTMFRELSAARQKISDLEKSQKDSLSFEKMNELNTLKGTLKQYEKAYDEIVSEHNQKKKEITKQAELLSREIIEKNIAEPYAKKEAAATKTIRDAVQLILDTNNKLLEDTEEMLDAEMQSIEEATDVSIHTDPSEFDEWEIKRLTKSNLKRLYLNGILRDIVEHKMQIFSKE